MKIHRCLFWQVVQNSLHRLVDVVRGVCRSWGFKKPQTLTKLLVWSIEFDATAAATAFEAGQCGGKYVETTSTGTSVDSLLSRKQTVCPSTSGPQADEMQADPGATNSEVVGASRRLKRFQCPSTKLSSFVHC
jgi:hypothetical protein